MRTITENILKYNELSDKAKANARHWFREASRFDSFWSDCCIDNMKEVAVHLGLDIEKIYFSGFHSQGDGAMYVGRFRLEDVNYQELEKSYPDKELFRIGRWLDEIKNIASDKGVTVHARISHRGHYYHENSMVVDFDIDAEDWETAKQFNHDHSDEIIEPLRDFACFIYKQLEREFEYSISDSSVEESIIANEYEFLENGDIY